MARAPHICYPPPLIIAPPPPAWSPPETIPYHGVAVYEGLEGEETETWDYTCHLTFPNSYTGSGQGDQGSDSQTDIDLDLAGAFEFDIFVYYDIMEYPGLHTQYIDHPINPQQPRRYYFPPWTLPPWYGELNAYIEM